MLQTEFFGPIRQLEPTTAFHHDSYLAASDLIPRLSPESINSLKMNGGSEWESSPPATGKPAARRF